MNASDGQVLRYRLLLDCFRDGQMNERQMQAHMADDPAFRAFVLESLAGEAAAREGQPAAMRGTGQGTVEPHAPSDNEVSLSDILRWAARWWWLILGSGLAGALLGLILHLGSQERHTVRLDMAVAESPLGSPAFVRDISISFLRRQVGTAVAIEPNQRTHAISLIEHGVPPDGIAMAQASMRGAAAALGGFLDAMVSNEYARMEARFAKMDPSPEAYASLSRFRMHVEAVREGLLASVTVTSERVRRQGLSLPALLAIGMLAGAGLCMGMAFAAGALRGRPAGPA